MQGSQYTYGVLHMPRWEVSIPVAREVGVNGRVQFLPIRRTCEAIGVDPQTQFSVIHDRFPDSVREVPFKAGNAGYRPQLALPSEDAALWIAGINPKRCKIAARGTLEDFVREAKLALQALLFKPDYVPPDPAQVGVLHQSSRVVQVFACECGRHWRIVTEDGDTTVDRLRPGEDA